MATYKVIQDIEAEDKFLGPLTLKQFIFGALGAFFGYLGFFAVTKGAPFLLVVFLPPMLIGFFLAIPWSSEQSTEIWVLAKLRFRLKPKERIWDQAGLEELVTITVPKKVEKNLTNGLDQTEVQSRLKALAETIDTRGWAVKNATLDDVYSTKPALLTSGERLIDLSSMPKNVPEIDVSQFNDVLDEDTVVAESFDKMIRSSSQARMEQSLDKMQRIRNGESLESVQQQPLNYTPPSDTSVARQGNGVAADDKELSQMLKNKRGAGDVINTHMRTLPVIPGAGSLAGTLPPTDDSPVFTSVPEETMDTDLTAAAAADQPQAQMTKAPDPAILNLAQNNDWNIDTIARNAKKNDPGADEVVISLR